MPFDTLTTCDGCNTLKDCNNEFVEVNHQSIKLNFCKKCYEEIEIIERELAEDFK